MRQCVTPKHIDCLRPSTDFQLPHGQLKLPHGQLKHIKALLLIYNGTVLHSTRSTQCSQGCKKVPPRPGDQQQVSKPVVA